MGFTGRIARMRVPKMVKNGFKSIFAYVDSLWICLMSVFWLCLRNKNHFTPISEQTCALELLCQSASLQNQKQKD
jgi:hypothetical protein